MKSQEIEPDDLHSKVKATIEINNESTTRFSESIVELHNPTKKDLGIKDPVIIYAPGDIPPTKKRTRRWREIRLLNRIANMLSLGIISYKEI